MAAATARGTSDACISPTIELSSVRPHLRFPASAGLTCQCGIPSRHRLLIKLSTTHQHQQVLGRDPYAGPCSPCSLQLATMDLSLRRYDTDGRRSDEHRGCEEACAQRSTQAARLSSDPPGRESKCSNR